MENKRLAAVIFDFDGVLIDSVDVKTNAFAELYKGYGKDIQKQVVSYHLQYLGISRLHKIRYYQSVLLGETIDEANINKLADKFANLVKRNVTSAAMIPGACNSLKFLHKKNIPMYIASGTPEDELQEIVEDRNLTTIFSGIYGSPRNKSEILEMIIKTNGYDSELCVMIGDALEDYKAAQHNSCKFVGVGNPVDSVFPEEIMPIPDLTTFIPHLAEKLNYNL